MREPDVAVGEIAPAVAGGKKGYRKRQGHRQPYTKVEIGKISF